MPFKQINWCKGWSPMETRIDPVMDAELRQRVLGLLRETPEGEGIGMFKTELDFFIAHQEELVQKYKGKVLAIKGEQILGVYPDALSAYLETQKSHRPGTFIIQPCIAGANAYTATINSHNVVI